MRLRFENIVRTEGGRAASVKTQRDDLQWARPQYRQVKPEENPKRQSKFIEQFREKLISNMRNKAVNSEYASDLEGKSLFADEFVEVSSDSDQFKSEDDNPTNPKLKRKNVNMRHRISMAELGLLRRFQGNESIETRISLLGLSSL